MMPNPKNADKFSCKLCDFVSSKESNYLKHLLTLKHKSLTNPNKKNAATNPKKFTCKCGKNYKHMSSLSCHKKQCFLAIHVLLENAEQTDIVNSSKPDDKNIIDILVKENSDFKNIILDVMKSNSILQQQMVELCKSSSNNCNNNTINSHNQTFNLQFFLNEQCKDAMNISDFANTFVLQLEDLESVGELGYVDGISKIIVDKLNAMDIYKRPMHCSDAKREIIYVKDENIWTKEEKHNPKLRQAIKYVSFNNMKLVYNWSNTYPESKNNESRLNDTYMKLVLESTGGKGPIIESENKIIRRIAKEIVIGKNIM